MSIASRTILFIQLHEYILLPSTPSIIFLFHAVLSEFSENSKSEKSKSILNLAHPLKALHL